MLEKQIAQELITQNKEGKYAFNLIQSHWVAEGIQGNF